MPRSIWISRFLILTLALLAAGRDGCPQDVGPTTIPQPAGELPANPFNGTIPFAVPPPGGDPRAARMRARLESFLHAQVDWLAEVGQLTDAQKQEARKISGEFQNTIFSEQWLGGGAWDGHRPPLFGTPPSKAALIRSQLAEELRQRVLQPPQTARIDQALRDRTLQRRRAYRTLAVAFLDQELFFTTSQRTLLLQELSEDAPRFDIPPAALRDDVSVRRPELQLPESFVRLLSPIQTKALAAASIRQNSSMTLSFEEGQVIEADRPTVARLQQEAGDAMAEAAELLIGYYQAECGLTEDQAGKLRLTSKRVAVQLAESWTGRFGQRALGPASGPVQFGFSADGFGQQLAGEPRTDVISQHPEWQKALDEVLGNIPRVPVVERTVFLRFARTNAVLVMLDDELWLRPAQRELMRGLVDSTFPTSWDVFPDISLTRAPGWCSIPVKQLKLEQLDFLNELQQLAWQQLQKSYAEP